MAKPFGPGDKTQHAASQHHDSTDSNIDMIILIVIIIIIIIIIIEVVGLTRPSIGSATLRRLLLSVSVNTTYT